LTKKRPSEASVKEEDEDDEDADDDDDEGSRKSFQAKRASDDSKLPRPLLRYGTSSKLTIVSPAALSVSPTIEKKKGPRPLMRAATVSSGLNSSPSKGIRETLKGFHQSPNSSPVSDRKRIASASDSTTEETETEAKQQPTKSFLRGATDSSLSRKLVSTPAPAPLPILDDRSSTRERCDSDEIPGPPSDPPPDDSPVYSRNRVDSGDSALCLSCLTLCPHFEVIGTLTRWDTLGCQHQLDQSLQRRLPRRHSP
jgi:hypothetical protein